MTRLRAALRHLEAHPLADAISLACLVLLFLAMLSLGALL